MTAHMTDYFLLLINHFLMIRVTFQSLHDNLNYSKENVGAKKKNSIRSKLFTRGVLVHLVFQSTINFILIQKFNPKDMKKTHYIGK